MLIGYIIVGLVLLLIFIGVLYVVRQQKSADHSEDFNMHQVKEHKQDKDGNYLPPFNKEF